MKLKSLVVGLVVIASSWASAATISITNFSGGVFSGVLGTNNALTSGNVFLGYYSGAEPSSSLNVASGFNQVGNTLAFTGGFVSGDISAALNVGNAAIGQQVYLIIGNGASIAASSQVLVWKPTSNPAGNTFVADNPVGGPDLIQFLTTRGTVVVGTTLTADVGAGSQSNFKLVAVVPEPSTALLGAVGALALLRRRRN